MLDFIMQDWILDLGWIVAKIMVVIGPLLIAVAYLTLAERRVIGFMQLRKGPNVAAEGSCGATKSVWRGEERVARRRARAGTQRTDVDRCRVYIVESTLSTQGLLFFFSAGETMRDDERR